MAEPVDEELVNGVARLAPTAKPSRIRSVGPALLVVAIYALCAVFGFWPAWSQGPAPYATPGGGDRAASMCFLTWAPYSLLHWHAPLFSNYGNTPYGINMMV